MEWGKPINIRSLMVHDKFIPSWGHSMAENINVLIQDFRKKIKQIDVIVWRHHFKVLRKKWQDRDR